MDIAEVARRSGVAASALRFYESRGLIESTGRHGLRRLFGTDVLDRLALISLGRTAGFTLEQIAAMLGPRGAPRIDRSALSMKADEIDATIRRLEGLREALRHAALCPAPSHMDCPTFRRLMQASLAPVSGKRTGRRARNATAARL